MKSQGTLRVLLWWTALVSGVLVWLPLVRGATQGAAYRWALSPGIGGRGVGGDYWLLLAGGGVRGDPAVHRLARSAATVSLAPASLSPSARGHRRSSPPFARRRGCASKARRSASTCRSLSPRRFCSAASPASPSSGSSETSAAGALPRACPGCGLARRGFERCWSPRCSPSRRCCSAAEAFRAPRTSWASAWCSGSG